MTDFGNAIKAVTEWPARYFFALALVAVALLVLSVSPWAAEAGIVSAPPWFRLSLTIGTLGFSAIGITKGLTHLAKEREAAKAARQRKIAFENQLRDLTPSEAAILTRYADGNVRVANFLVGSSGVVDAVEAQALAVKGHLYHIATRQTAFFTEVSYGIQEPTFAFLRRHPELLEGGRKLTASNKKSE